MHFKTHIIESCPSTNDLAREGRYRHGDVILARAQSSGRGQQGNSWDSEPGANLTLSVVLEPVFLSAADQFSLLQAVSLAVADALARIPDVKIKWPNDIYAGPLKIAGILIENDIMGPSVVRSIVGIGLNVNQMTFHSRLPNPTSVALQTGGRVDAQSVLENLYSCFSKRYAQLEKGYTDKLSLDYHARLYRSGKQSRYRTPDGEEFTGIIRGVTDGGALQVERATSGERNEYLFKQIDFLP